VENVAALLGRGMDRVLGDLSALGYDAEWHAVSAAHVGAPHIRDRLWLVAYPECEGLPRPFVKWSRLRIPADEAPTKLGDRLVSCGPEWEGHGGRVSVGDGFPQRLARPAVKAYGNAVVPQIPEMIGRAILASQSTITPAE
jgi:DNA (cytosine-5)-methyltransferase 1